MARNNDGTTRATYSVRLNPDLLKLLRHVAVDEKTSVGQLIEEGIKSILKKRKVGPGYTFHGKGMKLKDGNIDLDSDKYDIPYFLQKHIDE
jgi:hypothetical protein